MEAHFEHSSWATTMHRTSGAAHTFSQIKTNFKHVSKILTVYKVQMLGKILHFY